MDSIFRPLGRIPWGDWRLAALLCAGLLVAGSLARPTLPLPREVYRYLFVVDITQSMNARDVQGGGLPPERLQAAKTAIRRVLHDLPCGSDAGLGLYTTRSVQFLFEPMEICAHFPAIDDVLEHIDWRMAWAADSYVAEGLYATLRAVRKYDPRLRLVFLSDGQETPPLAIKPSFNGKAGEIRGVLVGIGGTRPSVVPRYDRENRFIGNWANVDIEPPPVSSTDYSEKVETQALPREGAYLSWLDEAHLKELAVITGLRYQRLEDPAGLSEFLRGSEFAERLETETDLRPFLALVALALLLVVHGVERGGPKRRP